MTRTWCAHARMYRSSLFVDRSTRLRTPCLWLVYYNQDRRSTAVRTPPATLMQHLLYTPKATFPLHRTKYYRYSYQIPDICTQRTDTVQDTCCSIKEMMGSTKPRLGFPEIVSNRELLFPRWFRMHTFANKKSSMCDNLQFLTMDRWPAVMTEV